MQDLWSEKASLLRLSLPSNVSSDETELIYSNRFDENMTKSLRVLLSYRQNSISWAVENISFVQ